MVCADAVFVVAELFGKVEVEAALSDSHRRETISVSVRRVRQGTGFVAWVALGLSAMGRAGGH